jgi:hypothetical protein
MGKNARNLNRKGRQKQTGFVLVTYEDQATAVAKAFKDKEDGYERNTERPKTLRLECLQRADESSKSSADCVVTRVNRSQVFIEVGSNVTAGTSFFHRRIW